MWWLWFVSAWGGSLDLIEVGGAWGTPAATGPTAVWFNPAALSFDRGTRVLVEGAPIVGSVAVDRTQPDYAWSPPPGCESAPTGAGCQPPVLGGLDRARFVGAVPFLGVATDFGVNGLGVGAALFVPHGRGGTEVDEPGSGRTHLRAANVQAIYASLGAAWSWRGRIGFGAAVSYVHSTWFARIDNQAATSYRDYPLVGDLLASELTATSVEDPELLVTTEFGPRKLEGERSGALRDDQVSFQAGIFARPHARVGLSLGYAHGARVDHTGDVSLSFGCPDPQRYPFLGGPFGASNFGVCDARMRGKTSVGYRYPMRVNVGVSFQPTDQLRLELMGAWVRWSQYTDFEITVNEVQSLNTELTEETAELLSLQRKWARGNRDGFWVGVDTKVQVHPQVLVGGRVLFDRAAVPSAYMSPNNADFDSVVLGALVALRPVPGSPIRLGLSYSGQISAPRVVTDSAFRVDIDPSARVEDRLMYPEMNGRFSGQVHRVGLSLLADIPGPSGRGARPTPPPGPGEAAGG